MTFKPSLPLTISSLLMTLAVLVACETNFTNTIDVQVCKDASYTKQIKPIIENKCLSCHGPNNPNGDFTTYEKLKPWFGEIKLHTFIVKNMPPPEAPQLTDEEAGLLQCWLNHGGANN